MSDRVAMPAIKALVTIVDRGKGERLAKSYGEHSIGWHYVCLGRGTANSDMLDLLGLGETERDVLISLAPKHVIDGLMTIIKERMYFRGPGKGIAFSLHLTAISLALSRLLNRDTCAVNEKENAGMEPCCGKYELVLAVVDDGFADEVMEAARGAGATGGTVFHARDLGGEDREKFFGISIQAAREIVAILVKREQKQAIMQAVAAAAGLQSAAHGILISVPVDDMAGIG